VINRFLEERPVGVKISEWQIAAGGDPGAIGRPLLPVDDLAAIITGKSASKWETLSANQRRDAARVQKRWTTRRVVFRPSKPPYRYTELVDAYVSYIEQLTGHPFRFSGSAGKPPGGPELRVLIAALDLALFGSGAPSPETLATIVQRRRERMRG
jgi:hypothetical protein